VRMVSVARKLRRIEELSRPELFVLASRLYEETALGSSLGEVSRIVECFRSNTAETLLVFSVVNISVCVIPSNVVYLLSV
jgi:hypothetical protein